MLVSPILLSPSLESVPLSAQTQHNGMSSNGWWCARPHTVEADTRQRLRILNLVVDLCLVTQYCPPKAALSRICAKCTQCCICAHRSMSLSCCTQSGEVVICDSPSKRRFSPQKLSTARFAATYPVLRDIPNVLQIGNIVLYNNQPLFHHSGSTRYIL